MRLVLAGRQRWLVWGALGVLVVVAGAAWLRLGGLQRAALAPLAPPAPAGAAATAGAAERPAPPEHRLAVHVAGAVRHPDVYELPPGSRVSDALAAAGGAAAEGQPQTLNLAAFLSDGDKVFVPTRADLAAAQQGNPPPESWSATRSAPPLAGGGLRVNLNRAARADLVRLPGVTGALATRILQYRERHGRFDRVDELRQVPGVDPETYSKLLPHVYVT